MDTKPTHIDGGVLDLVLPDVPDVVEVGVDSPIGTSYHSAIFIDVVLEQPIPHLLCRLEVYLKNSADWKLVRGYLRVSAGIRVGRVKRFTQFVYPPNQGWAGKAR